MVLQWACHQVRPAVSSMVSRYGPRSVPGSAVHRRSQKALHEPGDLLQRARQMIRTGKTSSQTLCGDGLPLGEFIPHRLYHFSRKLVKRGPISEKRANLSEESFIGKITLGRMGEI